MEIFDSIQGEGLNVGVPMTFVRFSKCNLACDFCDTPYNRVAIELSEAELVSNLLAREPSWVIFTGGEPCLQLCKKITGPLKAAGIKMAIETNGMIWPQDGALEDIDHITVSPKRTVDGTNIIPEDKRIHVNVAQWITSTRFTGTSEIRQVVVGTHDEIDMPGLTGPARFFSPVFHDGNPLPGFTSGDGHRGVIGRVDEISFRRCVFLVHKYRHAPHFARLSLQTHKLTGVR